MTISKLANLRICMPFYWKIGIRHAKISFISKKIRNRQKDKYKNILTSKNARRQFLQAEKTQIWAKLLHFNITLNWNNSCMNIQTTIITHWCEISSVYISSNLETWTDKNKNRVCNFCATFSLTEESMFTNTIASDDRRLKQYAILVACLKINNSN